MKHRYLVSFEKVMTTSLLLLYTFGLFAQDASQNVVINSDTIIEKNINIDEAIIQSLQNSNQLKVNKAKIDEAEASYQQAKNNALPELKGTASYLRVNNPDVSLKVKLGSNSSSGKSSKPNVSEASYAMANASLPLFSGFRIRDNKEAAKYQKNAALSDAENEKEEVIESTIAGYNDLYKASRSVELLMENLKQQDQRVIDFTNMEQNGLIAHNDLLKAQLQQSNVELSLLDAQNNLHIINTRMNLMLGYPESTVLKPDSLWTSSLDDAGSIVNWEHTGMVNRKDITALELREKSADMLIKATKGEYYPGLALTGGYIALNVPGLLSVTNAINLGIGLQYNIGSLWKTPAKVAMAKAQLRELQANENMLRDMVRIQVTQAYENYILSRKKINVYGVAVAQAEENYRIVSDKYKNTLATTTDLLEADVADLQARINYTFSRADAIVSLKKLQQAAGILSNNLPNNKFKF